MLYSSDASQSRGCKAFQALHHLADIALVLCTAGNCRLIDCLIDWKQMFGPMLSCDVSGFRFCAVHDLVCLLTIQLA